LRAEVLGKIATIGQLEGEGVRCRDQICGLGEELDVVRKQLEASKEHLDKVLGTVLGLERTAENEREIAEKATDKADMANAKFMVKRKRVEELEENEFGLFKKLSRLEQSLEDSGKKNSEFGLNIQALNQELEDLKTQHAGELAAKADEISEL
jgi:chromosome segregation ATPase